MASESMSDPEKELISRLERLAEQLEAGEPIDCRTIGAMELRAYMLKQRRKLEQARALLAAYRKPPEQFQHETIVFLVEVAFKAGEISHSRACELLEENMEDFKDRGWVQGAGLDAELEQVITEQDRRISKAGRTLDQALAERDEARKMARKILRHL